ncbi:hypothetical protein [Neobacillus terrae]|uniref:hypothetical protein n=1 Tax=Neobacillus terrae TaxID=3034837 RepID=UPI00140E2353|nr:hypothetical protein [Neobacillus terrae]NHM30650.1 hypothetical protein [Neobacillus terrae]
MKEIQGLITVQQNKGSEVVLIDGEPVSKLFSFLYGKMVHLNIGCDSVFPKHTWELLRYFSMKGLKTFTGVRNM